MFLFGNSVFAEETESVYDPGTTPDQIFYTFDQLVEEIQLFFVSNGTEETDLLLQFAQERLAEAKVMTEEEKQEFVQEAIEDYLKILTDAEEQIAEIIVNEELDEEELSELDEKLEETTELDEEMGEFLDEELLEAVEEKQDVLGELPSVVKGLDETKVKELRDSGLGFGQIAQVFLLANATGKTVEEVATLFSGEDKGFGDVAKELGIHPSELAYGKKKSTKQVESVTDQVEQDEEATEDETNSTIVETDEESDSEVVADVQVASVTNTEAKLDEEANSLAEEQRKAVEKQKEEAKRVAEEQRIAAEKQKEEAKRLAEEQRKAAEKQKEEARRVAEEQRKAAEKQKEEAKRVAEEQGKNKEKDQ